MAYGSLKEINENVLKNPGVFIENAEADFNRSVGKIVDEFVSDSDCDIVLLAGPSSSGKTTAAGMMAQRLKTTGKNAYIISLDDYYCDASDIPLTKSGLKDFENVNALDIELIHKNLNDLIKNREAEIPAFDFVSGRRKPELRKIKLEKGDMIIVEGIHALNPIITRGFDEKYIYKVYISVSTRITDGDRVVFGKRDLRFIRRMIRDFHYRNTPVEKTFSQWQEVISGEDKYIFPFEENAKFRIDSFHPYEANIFKNEALTLLDAVDVNSEFYRSAEKLKKLFELFEPIDVSKLPETSLLREFI